MIFFSFTTLPESKQNLLYSISDEKAYSTDRSLVSANTKFGFNIFNKLVAEDRNKNIVISPLSISMALTMTFSGAEGTTKDAMTKTLEFGNMSLEMVSQKYSNSIGSLENADQQVSLVIGNSIWMKKEFEPIAKPTFIDRIKTYYDGEIFTRDFWNQQTVNDINGWVEKKTDGKISEVIQKIDPKLVLFLINAIFFKGERMIKFNESKTQKQDFFLSEG